MTLKKRRLGQGHQPRPLGAFPWLWRQAKALWGRDCSSIVLFHSLANVQFEKYNTSGECPDVNRSVMDR